MTPGTRADSTRFASGVAVVLLAPGAARAVAVTHIGVSASPSISVSDSFTSPLGLCFVLNPYLEDVYAAVSSSSWIHGRPGPSKGGRPDRGSGRIAPERGGPARVL